MYRCQIPLRDPMGRVPLAEKLHRLGIGMLAAGVHHAAVATLRVATRAAGICRRLQVAAVDLQTHAVPSSAYAKSFFA